MTQPTLSSFFTGGGARTAKFPKIGTTVKGEIVFVSPPEPQTDFRTREPIPDKLQVRIVLKTNQRDPDFEDDDGSRTIYVKGWMTGAVGDALRKAGVNEPKVGGTLAVTYEKDGEASGPGLSPPKLYVAVYTPPGAAATASYFNKPSSSNGSLKPKSISDEAWAQMDESTRKAVAATMSEPPF